MAAEQGFAWAQWRLGMAYEEGEGVPKDNAKSVKWYTKAAEQGDASAQRKLGDIYANGEGVPVNDGTAVEWYTKAAEQGDAFAQSRLGEAYEHGKGVPVDFVKAYAWFNLVAAHGFGGIGVWERSQLAQKMTKEQVADAQALASTLHEEIQRRQRAVRPWNQSPAP